MRWKHLADFFAHFFLFGHYGPFTLLIGVKVFFCLFRPNIHYIEHFSWSKTILYKFFMKFLQKLANFCLLDGVGGGHMPPMHPPCIKTEALAPGGALM